MKNKLRYFIEMLKIMWSADKKYFISTFLEICVFSVIPFISLFLTKYSISMLTNLTEYKMYLLIILLLLGLRFFMNIIQIELNTLNNIKGNLIGQKLYSKIFEKCLTMDYEQLHKKEILEKKEMATKAFQGGALAALVTYFKTILGNLIVILGILYIVAQADWIIMVISLVIVIINGYLSLRTKKIQYNTDVEMIPINRKIEYYIGMSSDFSVAKEVRLFDIQTEIINRYNKLYMETFKLIKKVFKTSKENAKLSEFTNFILEIAIYVILGYKVLEKRVLNIAEFSLYAGAIRQFKDSMSAILGSYAEIEQNAMHLKDYFEFIQISSKFDRSTKKISDGADYEICFENVSFIYPGQDKYALKNINITIKSGERLSIVGENGSGKTTFVKLLTRLYDPTEGKIYLNGVDISTIKYKDYLKLFSAIFQDFKIYAFSVKDNISMLKEDANEQRIWSILEKVGLENKIKNLPKGLTTFFYRVYDDQGIEFSGGEGQKLAIARALYKNTPLVILDEPTAALDPRSEYEIFKKFSELTSGRTSVYISHRLSSCKFSDNIAVFDHGEIVEYGSHDNLIKKNGYYAELFNMQAQSYIN